MEIIENYWKEIIKLSIKKIRFDGWQKDKDDYPTLIKSLLRLHDFFKYYETYITYFTNMAIALILV